MIILVVIGKARFPRRHDFDLAAFQAEILGFDNIILNQTVKNLLGLLLCCDFALVLHASNYSRPASRATHNVDFFSIEFNILLGNNLTVNSNRAARIINQFVIFLRSMLIIAQAVVSICTPQIVIFTA